MPLVILIIGVVFLIAAVRGTNKELGDLFKAQFVGPGSFTSWALAFLSLALLGTIPQLRPLARVLMGLLLLVIIIVQSREANLLTLLQAQLLGRAFTSGLYPL